MVTLLSVPMIFASSNASRIAAARGLCTHIVPARAPVRGPCNACFLIVAGVHQHLSGSLLTVQELNSRIRTGLDDGIQVFPCLHKQAENT